MASSKATTVAAYLEELPAERREVVSKVRDVVRENLPKGYEEIMGHGMIMYSVPLKVLSDTYNGHPPCYAALAAQKNHDAIYLMCVYGTAERAGSSRMTSGRRGRSSTWGKRASGSGNSRTFRST